MYTTTRPRSSFPISGDPLKNRQQGQQSNQAQRSQDRQGDNSEIQQVAREPVQSAFSQEESDEVVDCEQRPGPGDHRLSQFVFRPLEFSKHGPCVEAQEHHGSRRQRPLREALPAGSVHDRTLARVAVGGGGW